MIQTRLLLLMVTKWPSTTMSPYLRMYTRPPTNQLYVQHCNTILGFGVNVNFAQHNYEASMAFLDPYPSTLNFSLTSIVSGATCGNNDHFHIHFIVTNLLNSACCILGVISSNFPLKHSFAHFSRFKKVPTAAARRAWCDVRRTSRFAHCPFYFC